MEQACRAGRKRQGELIFLTHKEMNMHMNKREQIKKGLIVSVAALLPKETYDRLKAKAVKEMRSASSQSTFEIERSLNME